MNTKLIFRTIKFLMALSLYVYGFGILFNFFEAPDAETVAGIAFWALAKAWLNEYDLDYKVVKK